MAPLQRDWRSSTAATTLWFDGKEVKQLACESPAAEE